MEIAEFLNFVTAHQFATKAMRRLYIERLAPDFNPFQFIQPGELRLSGIIAWMLDPFASHGQGGRFLEAFLEMLGSVWQHEAIEKAKVRTEEGTPGGPIDILVSSGSRVVAIENKPSAPDQEKQVQRYLDALDRPPITDCRLIYLSVDGRNPSPHSICAEAREQRKSAGQLVLWNYKGQIAAWLEACRVRCRADRVTSFIEMFAEYVSHQFGGGRVMGEQDQIVAAILESSERVAAAMQIVVAANAIRSELLIKLRNQIENRLPSSWDLEHYDLAESGGASYLSLKIRFPETPPDFRFALQFNTGGYKRLMYGMVTINEQVQGGSAVREAITKSLGNGQINNPWWCWYRPASPQDALFPMEADWSVSVSPWKQIADDKIAPTILGAAAKFEGALRGLVLG